MNFPKVPAVKSETTTTTTSTQNNKVENNKNLSQLIHEAHKGSCSAAYQCGKYYAQETGHNNEELAAHYFGMIICREDKAEGLTNDEVADAAYQLGVMYTEGRGVEKNDELAKFCFKKAATCTETPTTEALYAYGKSLVISEPRLAYVYLIKAEDAGHVLASYELALLCAGKAINMDNNEEVIFTLILSGRGSITQTNYKDASIFDPAVRNYKYLFANKNPFSFSNSNNFFPSLTHLQTAAMGGCKEALFQLGMIYSQAAPVKINPEILKPFATEKLVVTLATSIADEELDARWVSHPKCEGFIVQSNETAIKKINDNFAQGISCMMQASDAGHPAASYCLGILYAYGVSEANFKYIHPDELIPLYTGLQTSQSDDKTELYLVRAYTQGTREGASKEEKAVAAEAAYQFALSLTRRGTYSNMRSFARSLYSSSNVSDDPQVWFRNAAKLGHQEAMLTLNCAEQSKTVIEEYENL